MRTLKKLPLHILFLTILLLSQNYLLALDECASSDYTHTMSATNTSDTHTVSMTSGQSISYYIQASVAGTLTITTNNGNNKIHLIGSETTCPTGDTSGNTSLIYSDSAPFDINVVVYASNNVSHTLTIQFTPLGFSCANPKDFTTVYSDHAYAKLVQIGNTSLCKNNGSGVCTDPGTSTNNNINMMHNDYDDTDGTTDNASTTTNSSAAILDIPAGKNVLWAGLFWQGYMVGWSDAQKEAGRTIKYKHADDSYQSVTNAEMNWVYFDSNRFYYQSFIEITSYVNTNGPGYYWVGDIATTEGQPTGGSFGAWSLVVVYEDNDEDFKNITVFHGYQAFAGTTDINNAISYASTNSCSTTDTGVGNSVSSTLSGFLTPKEGSVNSSLAVFAGEGDIGLTGDSGSLTDKNNVEQDLTNTLNPATNIMNATISKDGSNVTTGLPYYSANSLGADIDTYDVSSILGNEQSTTNIKFVTSGDGYMPGMYALETQLYVPDFCYDYAYKQQGLFITEDNNGTQAPKLSGNVLTNEEITLSIYIKNLVASDIAITDMYVDFMDINTTQANYVAESTKLSKIGNLIPESISDSSLSVGTNSDGDYINNLPIGLMDSNDYFYAYYGINPNQSTLDIPLNLQARYNLTIGGETIPYTLKLSEQIPMCTTNNFKFIPARSIFNVVHNDYYDVDTGGSTEYYNIPTQVTKREGNFKVVSFDPDNLDTLIGVSTTVAVEMIDASAFHDIDASCKEPTSAITPRVWVNFDNNVTSTLFDKNVLIAASDKANANAVASGGTSELPLSSDFYKEARENAAFRISYNAANTDGDLLQYEESGGLYLILNFPVVVQTIGTCRQTVIYPNASGSLGPTDQVAVACGNAGNTGITKDHLDACMECIYGYDTRFICSRDNFAIRPEALLMHVDDQNQTSPAAQSRLTTNYSGVAGASASVVNIAAGYDYSVKATATNHLDNTASSGYTKTYSSLNGDTSEYTWEPRSGVTAGACNDETDKEIIMTFLDGMTDTNVSIDQVGEYELNLTDTSWTSVDNDPSSVAMSHHTGAYFTTTADCVQNTSATQAVNSSTKNGCNITSEHTNNSNSLVYNDYDITIHPYSFDMSTITPTVGLNNTALGANSFIYMADMSFNNAQDQNMSFHLNGNIRASGENNSSLSNFVTGCYAKPVDINITRTMDNVTTVAYQYRFNTLDSSNANISTVSGDLNNTAGPIQLNDGNFTKAQSGLVNSNLNLNFFRENNTSINPRNVTFNTYSTDCTTSANCTFNADLASKTTHGEMSVGNNVTHYYGRSHASRQRYQGPTGTANIYYEVYCFNTDSTGIVCTKALLQQGLNSKRTDDVRWFINENHNSGYGNAGTVVEKDSLGRVNVAGSTTGNHPDNSTLMTYDLSRGYPYKTTMQNNASRWLIYNEDDPTATRNTFPVEFENAATGWSGEHETDTTTKDPGTATINRRTMW